MGSKSLEGEYIDIIEKTSSKLASWDPSIKINVGAYGEIDKNTGNPVQKGNIYDSEFQRELDSRGVKIRMADYPPQEGPDEDDIIITSSGVDCKDINVEFDPCAPFKGKWAIESGKREAILYMHRPRLTSLPEDKMPEDLYQVDMLVDKWLVTNIYTCPAYFMYLSDKGNETVSAALASESSISPIAGATDSTGRLHWSVDYQSGHCREASDPMGEHSFAPLCSLKHPIPRFSFVKCAAPLQRKYTDLIYNVSSKWVNWFPSSKIKVGDYGTVDEESGDLVVDGNIYDPEFQEELVKHNIKINLADHQPQEGSEEDDFIITSSGTKHRNVNLDNELGIGKPTNASVKGQWSFECSKRAAILIIHRPRLIFLPKNVILDQLYKVDKLTDKKLVTSTFTCPAYSMYLSDKAGGKVSLALATEAPIASAVGTTAGVNNTLSWVAKAQGGLLREACDKAGKYRYTPLFALKHRFERFFLKRHIWDREAESNDDGLCFEAYPPWGPLDEEGHEDTFDSDDEPSP